MSTCFMAFLSSVSSTQGFPTIQGMSMLNLSIFTQHWYRSIVFTIIVFWTDNCSVHQNNLLSSRIYLFEDISALTIGIWFPSSLFYPALVCEGDDFLFDAWNYQGVLTNYTMSLSMFSGGRRTTLAQKDLSSEQIRIFNTRIHVSPVGFMVMKTHVNDTGVYSLYVIPGEMEYPDVNLTVRKTIGNCFAYYLQSG